MFASSRHGLTPRAEARKQTRLLTAILILSMAAGCTAAPTHLETNTAAYQFEAEPRSVLAPLGIERSRFPKLGTFSTRGSDGWISIMAVVDEGDRSHLRLFGSQDSGDSFALDGEVSPPASDVSAGAENSPTYVFGERTAALWEQDGDLVFARAPGWVSPREFSEPVSIPVKESPSMNSFATLAMAPDNNLYVAWLDGREGPIGVYLAKSTDGGVTFGANMQVEPSVCGCCRPTVAFGENGLVHVAWRHIFEGNIRDIVVATSRDGGDTFEEPVRVAEDNWMIEGCPTVGPVMAQQGGHLYVAWYTKNVDDRLRVRLTWSDDGAKTFAPAMDASGDVIDPTRPSLSASPDGHTVLTFQGREPNDDGSWGVAMGYVVDIDKTGDLSKPVAIPGTKGSVSTVSVEAGQGGRVFLAWTESIDGTQTVRFTRARRVSSQ